MACSGSEVQPGVRGQRSYCSGPRHVVRNVWWPLVGASSGRGAFCGLVMGVKFFFSSAKGTERAVSSPRPLNRPPGPWSRVSPAQGLPGKAQVCLCSHPAAPSRLDPDSCLPETRAAAPSFVCHMSHAHSVPSLWTRGLPRARCYGAWRVGLVRNKKRSLLSWNCLKQRV